MDFGLTSVVRGLNSFFVSRVRGYTAAWAAPEVLLEGCDKATPEADIFSFGMVVIEVGPRSSHAWRGRMDSSLDVRIPVKVFTGDYPFSGLTEMATSLKIMSGERPARPQEAQELGLTDSVWDMTLKCWRQDPADRPTVTGVVELLREWSVFSLFMKPTS